MAVIVITCDDDDAEFVLEQIKDKTDIRELAEVERLEQ